MDRDSVYSYYQVDMALALLFLCRRKQIMDNEMTSSTSQ